MIVFLFLFLFGCGSSGEGDTDTQSTPSIPYSNLVVIGNSLTYTPQVAALEWLGNWGMAASAQSKDFAHLTAKALDLPVVIYNIASLERTLPNYTADIARSTAEIVPLSAVVVELGDNVDPNNLSEFNTAYSALLGTIHGARLVCTSTWWHDPSKDDLMREQCLAHNGRYLYIGDIFDTNQDDIGRYANQGVDIHPHDSSMQRIADRITAELQRIP